MQTKWVAVSIGALIVVAAGLTNWLSAPKVRHFSGPAQGSTYNISYWTTQDVEQSQLQQLVQQELDRIDLVMSNYRPDSVIEQFNQQQTSEPQEVGTELTALIETARDITQASAGCYDLTVKPMFDLWGFKADKFNQPTAAQLEQTQQFVGMDKITSTADGKLSKANPAMRVDVSSIAQGYTVKQLAMLLEQQGVTDYLVEVGGELQVRGKKPGQQAWKVAVEKPLPDNQQLQKIITVLQDEPLSVMTSGTYRHYFDAAGQRFSHVLDARIGAPVRHQTVSTTVLIEDATLGDGWSTAFLCLGSQQGLAVANQLGLKVMFIDQQGEQLTELLSDALQNTTAVKMESLQTQGATQ